MLTHADGVFLSWMANSLLYAGVGGAVATLVAAMAGYALAKYVFPGREAVFNVILAGVLVPTTALALPLFLLFSRVDATDTSSRCCCPAREPVRGVPVADLRRGQRARRADRGRPAGRGREMRTFFAISIRLMSPALVTVFLFQFVAIWNNFFLPLMMLQDPATLPGHARPAHLELADRPRPRAAVVVIVGALLSVVPLIVAFLACSVSGAAACRRARERQGADADVLEVSPSAATTTPSSGPRRSGRGRRADARGRRQPRHRRRLLLGAAGARARASTSSAGSTGCSTCCTAPASAVDLATADRLAAAVVHAPRTRDAAAWPPRAAALGLRRPPGATARSSPAYRATPPRSSRRLAERYAEHPASPCGTSQRVRLRTTRTATATSPPPPSAPGCADRYGDLDALNDAWGTTFWSQRYGDWDEVAAARRAPRTPNPAQQLDFRRFSSDALLALLPRRARHAARGTPGHPGHHQLHGPGFWARRRLALGAARWTWSPSTTTSIGGRPDAARRAAFAPT